MRLLEVPAKDRFELEAVLAVGRLLVRPGTNRS